MRSIKIIPYFVLIKFRIPKHDHAVKGLYKHSLILYSVFMAQNV